MSIFSLQGVPFQIPCSVIKLILIGFLIYSRIDLGIAMAGTYNTEQQRVIGRIKCIAFREVKYSGATFIDRKWIADRKVTWKIAQLGH